MVGASIRCRSTVPIAKPTSSEKSSASSTVRTTFMPNTPWGRKVANS
jgi:hypothetical protein